MERMFKTSKESYQALEDINSLIRCVKNNPREPWETVEKLEKDRQEIIRNLIPEVGVRCTLVYFSDYRAGTVVEVNEKKNRVGVMFNKTKCIDYYAGDYEILPELEGGVKYVTQRRNGLWVYEGHETKDGVVLALHYHRHYIDPHY